MDTAWLGRLVAHNVAIKAKMVAADPFEKGERAHLNFGHTIGHAIESVSEYKYSHGESVALGMVAESLIAEAMGMLAAADRQRIVALIAAAGLPTGGLKLDRQAITGRMAFDKKVKGGRIQFVLPDRIGHVLIRDDVPVEIVQKAIEGLGI